MSSTIDSIFSLIVGSLVVLMVIGLMGTMRSSAADQTLNTVVQSNLTTVTAVLENDLRKAGYGIIVAAGDSGILYADTAMIKMKGDLDFDGDNQDTVRYSLGSAANVNPRTKNLLRTSRMLPPNASTGAVVQKINLGVTRMRFTYYDAAGNEINAIPKIARPSTIRSVRIQLKLESTYPSEVTSKPIYSYAQWEGVVKPRNLR